MERKSTRVRKNATFALESLKMEFMDSYIACQAAVNKQLSFFCGVSTLGVYYMGCMGAYLWPQIMQKFTLSMRKLHVKMFVVAGGGVC